MATSGSNGTALHALDATEQARLVASGQASALELVEAAIGRIEGLNPDLNAVIWNNFDEARRLAAAVIPNGEPFGGVPFLLKDIGANQAGLPHWLGNRALKTMDLRASDDTVLGSRFRTAGLITLGKTNLPEFGSTPTTQPLSCGPTNNPWDLSRSPAGSSGGSAAAVASGMVAIAHANDGGGSTRLPASWCGLVGLKTTRGRIPNPESVSRLTSELAVTKTVRDTARLLDAVHGVTDADLYSATPPNQTYESMLNASITPLKIAVITDAGHWPLDQECQVAAHAGATMLESLGHNIEAVGSDVLLGPDSTVNGELWTAGIARRVQTLNELAGRTLTEDEVEPYNWAAAVRGATMPAVDFAATEERQQRWVRTVLDWMDQFDLVVTPTSGAIPMKTEDLWPPKEKPWKIAKTYGQIGAFTLPFNVTGQPAISLPLHWSVDGLPVGVQIVAKMGREDLLLQVASQLEQSNPWYHRYQDVRGNW